MLVITLTEYGLAKVQYGKHAPGPAERWRITLQPHIQQKLSSELSSCPHDEQNMAPKTQSFTATSEQYIISTQ